MKKIFNLCLLSLALAVVSLNTSDAAFPKDKQISQTALVSTTTTTAAVVDAPATKAEIKAELKKVTKGNNAGSKNKIVAALLAFFLGGFGVHSFYMGNKKKGFIQLGITVVGIVLTIAGLANFVSGGGASIPTLAIVGYLMILGVGIWAFVDFIRILTGGLAPEEGFKD